MRCGDCSCVPHTTREPRAEDVDAEDYHFVSHERFAAMRAAHAFAEVHLYQPSCLSYGWFGGGVGIYTLCVGVGYIDAGIVLVYSS